MKKIKLVKPFKINDYKFAIIDFIEDDSTLFLIAIYKNFTFINDYRLQIDLSLNRINKYIIENAILKSYEMYLKEDNNE